MGDPLGSPRVATPFLFLRIVFQPRVLLLLYFIFLMDFIITIIITYILFDGEKKRFVLIFSKAAS